MEEKERRKEKSPRPERPKKEKTAARRVKAEGDAPDASANPKSASPKKEKKKRGVLFKVLLGAGLLLGGAVIAALLLGGTLFLRLSRPGNTVFAEEDGGTPAPTVIAAPTPAPAPAVTPEPGATPSPTPIPTPQPLHDLYPQTFLTDAQKAAVGAQNANTEYTNILLVGVDRRGTRGDSNADVIMIASVDRRNGRLKLTSLLRDLYVPIEGYEPARINSAAAKGGIPLLMRTVNSALQTDLKNYVLVDFSMFEDIVDKLGGVTVRMSAAEISAANDNIAGLNKQKNVPYLWDGFIFAEPGNVRLTGKQALGYARIRHLDSDFVRTNRQFKVLTAIFAKFRSKDVAKQYALLYDLMPMVETDLTPAQILDIAAAALSMDTRGLLHMAVPQEGYYKSARVGGSSVLVMDMPMHAWLVHRFIYTSAEEPDEAKVLSGGKSLPPRTPGPTLPPTPVPSLLPGETPPDQTDTPDIPYIPEIPEAVG
ncbi:MAG TPA: LCP family protein [Feifaniaceae bacterium]|nr:LCP family protein [Feifaniaceae bacterium]